MKLNFFVCQLFFCCNVASKLTALFCFSMGSFSLECPTAFLTLFDSGLRKSYHNLLPKALVWFTWSFFCFGLHLSLLFFYCLVDQGSSAPQTSTIVSRSLSAFFANSGKEPFCRFCALSTGYGCTEMCDCSSKFDLIFSFLYSHTKLT